MTHPVFPDLKDASVYITGGGSGIGAALTDAFLAQGSKVAFVGRSDATAFVDEMEEKHGLRPHFMACDITDTAAMKETMAEAAAKHGPITRLVNNAAFDDRHTTMEVTEDYWDKMIAINFKAYFFACQAAIPGMVEAGYGSIINFSSISYMMGNAGYPIYTGSNAGINGMTRSLAREWGPKGVRVNALMPGWVIHPGQMKWATGDKLEVHKARQCLPDTLVPEDIQGGCLFLASKASKAMTGQALVIDGGVVVTG